MELLRSTTCDLLGSSIREHEHEHVQQQIQDEKAKWKHTVTHKLNGVKAEKAWTLLGRFCGIKEWLSSVQICEVLEGEVDKPGCVRYIAGGKQMPDGNWERWVIEKLLTLDQCERSFSYIMLESSYGYQGYSATMSVMDDPDDDSDCGSSFAVWSFELDPIPLKSPDETFPFLTEIFKRMMVSLENTSTNYMLS